MIGLLLGGPLCGLAQSGLESAGSLGGWSGAIVPFDRPVCPPGWVQVDKVGVRETFRVRTQGNQGRAMPQEVKGDAIVTTPAEVAGGAEGPGGPSPKARVQLQFRPIYCVNR